MKSSLIIIVNVRSISLHELSGLRHLRHSLHHDRSVFFRVNLSKEMERDRSSLVKKIPLPKISKLKPEFFVEMEGNMSINIEQVAAPDQKSKFLVFCLEKLSGSPIEVAGFFFSQYFNPPTNITNSLKPFIYSEKRVKWKPYLFTNFALFNPQHIGLRDYTTETKGMKTYSLKINIYSCMYRKRRPWRSKYQELVLSHQLLNFILSSDGSNKLDL